MQLRGNEQTATVGGMAAKRSQEFRFAMNDRMFEVFSSSIYQNKIRAIIREICTNALDAHISVNKADVPFEVQLPSSFEPILRVRDFGTGMSEDQIYDIYTVYFESTKGDSNSEVGGYGLGTKSPLSYVDAFQIRSYQNGVLKTYTCYKNGKTPKTDLVFEGTTDEPDGLEVSMAINTSDISRFQQEAAYVLSTFDVKPECYDDVSYGKFELIEQDEDNKIFSVNRRLDEKFYIKMGPVLYPLTVDMKNKIQDSLWWSLLKNHNDAVVFMAEIGEYDVPPSRENIDNTKHNLKLFDEKLEKLNKIYSDFLDELEADVVTIESGRKMYQYTLEKCIERFGEKTGRSLHDFVKESDKFKIRSIEGHDILMNAWRGQFKHKMKELNPKMRYIEWSGAWKTYALSYSSRNQRFPVYVDEGLTVFLVKGAYTNLYDKHITAIKNFYNITEINTVNENSENTIEFLQLVYGDDLKLVYTADMLKDIGYEKEAKTLTRTFTPRGTKQHDVEILGKHGRSNDSMSINDVEDVDSITYFIEKSDDWSVKFKSGCWRFMEYINIAATTYRQFLDCTVVSIPPQLKKAVERNNNFVHFGTVIKEKLTEKINQHMWDEIIFQEYSFSHSERKLLELDTFKSIRLCRIDNNFANMVTLESLAEYCIKLGINQGHILMDRIEGLQESQTRLFKNMYKKYPLLKVLDYYDLQNNSEHVSIYMNAVDQKLKEEKENAEEI